jgi:hypothetical protein
VARRATSGKRIDFVEPALPAIAETCQEKFNSRPVAPTGRDKKPFGENVEGLSYCGAKGCVVEAAVQKDNFHESTLGGVISRLPLPSALGRRASFITS